MSNADGPTPEGPAPDPSAPGPVEGPSQGVDELEAEAELVEELIADAEQDLGQSAESAVAEAVDLASRLESERDEYLDHSRRIKAEFENYKRRVEAQRIEQRAHAALDLVRELLPILDACDAAVSHGHDQVEPLRTQLIQTLEKQGLAPVADAGVAFDPNIHEAVMHEEGDGDAVVAEVLRAGYVWNDRVVRAAMVKVRG